jgi:hypothetical protein
VASRQIGLAACSIILVSCAPAYRGPAAASEARSISCPLSPSASLLTTSRSSRGEAGLVYGLVLDSVTLHPIANAIVQFDGDTARQFVTDTLGRFKRIGLAPGWHEIRILFIGYRALRDSLAVLPRHSLYAAARMSPSILDGPCSGFEIIVSDSSKHR